MAAVCLRSTHAPSPLCVQSPPDAPPPAVACTASLPNVGNEGHSYLHHMRVRHASLAPLTLFLPDTLWNDPTHAKPHFTHDVVVRPPRGEAERAARDASA